MSEGPRVETYKEQASMTVMVDGKPQVVPVELEVTDTYYADGRKDVAIKVPALKSGAVRPEGD